MGGRRPDNLAIHQYPRAGRCRGDFKPTEYGFELDLLRKLASILHHDRLEHRSETGKLRLDGVHARTHRGERQRGLSGIVVIHRHTGPIRIGNDGQFCRAATH